LLVAIDLRGLKSALRLSFLSLSLFDEKRLFRSRGSLTFNVGTYLSIYARSTFNLKDDPDDYFFKTRKEMFFLVDILLILK